MVIKKVKKIIRKKLYEYPIYDRLINELELEKDTTEGRDINSSIRSKNKINRTVESQVIKSINIDSKINEYKGWQEIIDNVLQELRKNDKTKLKVIEYKFFANIPEDIIADELYVSRTTVRTYINDIYFEIGILATFNNLISKNIFNN
jgi:methyltransferase-like protein